MKTLKLTAPYLLWLYAIMPISLLFVAADIYLWDFKMRSYLTTREDILALWAFLLTLPHVIGSHITMFDKEYIKYYKGKLIAGIAICFVLAVVVRAVFGFDVLFFIVASYNMYHILMQQFGVSLMLLSKKPDTWYKIWKYLSLIGGLIIYVLIFGGHYFSPEAKRWMNLTAMAALIAAVPSVIAMLKTVSNDKPFANKWYFYSTILMVYSCWALFVGGYPFVAVLIPRVVHDVTAFSVYAVHDQNRNTPKPHNLFYKMLAFTHVPPVVLCVPLSIGLGIALGVLQNQYMAISYFSFTILLLHYFMEGHIWKGGSIHRNSLPIVK